MSKLWKNFFIDRKIERIREEYVFENEGNIMRVQRGSKRDYNAHKRNEMNNVEIE